MADIFNGGTVKLFYNLDTANQNVISSGNIEIENVATFPTFSISDSANKIETYDSEYTRTVVGDKAIGDLEIVVNYRPDSETHQFLDSAYDNKTEFQLIVNYIEDQDAGKVEAVIVSGNINSRMISGDKDDVVRMTYTYSPRTIISMGTRLIPPVLRRGDYGVGSDGTPDYPQYSPQEAEGNAFVMIPAADTDNPAGTDLYGIELVSQPTGQSNTNLMLTDSGDLRIYARNNTTPWSRVYTSGESDTLYLSKANNLSDLDNVITARSNLGILSTTENDARYMIGSRNLSELTDKAAALSNLGILSTVQNDTRYLKSESNLSDLANVATSRTNLQLDRFEQSTNETVIYSPDKIKYIGISNGTNGSWGVYDSQTTKWIPLGVGQGGTGSTTDEGARINLKLDRIRQQDNGTFITSPDYNSSFFVYDGADWGCIDSATAQVKPLLVNYGGTGATTAEGARWNLNINRLVQADGFTLLNAPDNTRLVVANNKEIQFQDQNGVGFGLPILAGGTGAMTINGARDNLNLGTGNDVDFRGVNAHNWSDSLEYPSGGFLTSTLYNTSNGVRAIGRLYSEIPPDGIPKTVIQSTDNAGRNAYMSYDVNGLLQGIGTLSVNSKIRTPTIAVTDRMSVGTPGDAQALGARSIAIGDSDTGLAQRSDGILDVYTDSVNRSSFSPSGLTISDGKIIINQGNRGDNCIYIGSPRDGSSSAFIAGIVDGVPNWANWRDRAAGMIVEIPGSAKCVNIWKSVQWGTAFTTSFDTYNPDPNTVEARLNVGGAFFMYTSAGVGTATSWVSTSDQRLKSNIEEITGSLDKLKKLTGYTYDKRSDLTPNEHTYTSHEAGLIAQEVQKVLPEAVTSSGDELLLAVNSYAVQALQINATKELDAKVEANEETIAVLTSKVEAQALQLEAQQQQIDELKALVQSLITK
ncbi:tail fiber domain-containing protein [Citrobacter sp. Cpo012]|uniref:tail fiber domain-containing protein n=1 Tax=Citrobacter sp. Cpo012 TaxID=2985120 RepID=UPI0025783A7C|nr:tail fiber domain-containing protein [Citrobacter sp. Cpo012]MDM2910104.1 tail fiber domain-containing protein [Citrobacter sp. Cpo012]